MNDFRADLHIHSNYSDGSCSPEELMIEVKNRGLQGLSITDHDTIAAYDEAVPLANKYDLLLLSGVEFSATRKGESVHILGYSFSLKSHSLRALCARHRQRRVERNIKIIEKLKKLGYEIDPRPFLAEDDNHKTWGRPHIAQALIEQGVVSSIQEAFDQYLAEGKKAYDPGEPILVEETIEAIHKAGGYAILAHPHLIKRERFVRELLQLDFDGIEGYYARLPSNQEQKWIRLAKERGWIITGGSDYHGSVKPYSQLGSSWVDETTFRILYDHFCSTQSLTD